MKKINLSCIKKIFCILIFFLFAFLAENAFCEQSQKREYWPTKEWKTSTPEEQKMDSTKLEQINTYVEENCPKLRSILISRNGYIVFEKYYAGDANYANDIDAATQSITSALIGIALGQGHIKNIDQKMYTFFPEYAPGITDPRRKKITIKHLLTMTPGFRRLGAGSYGDMESDFKQFIDFEPGETFAYNTGASHLLSGIITKSTNMSTLQFADKYLFKPLGIPTPRWKTGFGGYNHGGGGLYMRTRDMAKIGYLYLRNGVWDGRQIIPKKWVKESTQKQSIPIESISSVEIDIAYGYQWWVLTLPTGHPAFSAAGSGGQFIYINPKLNLVTVMTTDSRELGIPQNRKIFLLFIYPSVIE